MATVEDFEHNDLSAHYDGDLSDYDINGTNPYDGSYSLEGDPADLYSFISSFPGDGLNYYPEIGDRISWRVYLESGDMEAPFEFGVQTEGSFYNVDVNTASDEFRVGIRDSGTLISSFDPIGDVTNEWLSVEVEWTEDENGDVVLSGNLYDSTDTLIASAEYTDSDRQFTSGGIAFRTEQSGSRYWDAISAESIVSEPVTTEENTWDTLADWDTAQSRTGVATFDTAVRDQDEIWQGWDPFYPPLGGAGYGYWPLDDDGGSTTPDYVGSNDATINGASAGAVGVLSSNAYSFDGTNDWLETDAQPASDGAGTMVYFVNYDTTGGEQLSGYYGSGESRFYYGIWEGADLLAGFGDSFGSTGFTPSSDQWYMLTLTGDGSTARAYVDDTEIASFSYSYTDDPEASVDIGARDTGGSSRDHLGYVDGRISDFMLFDQALSSSQIQALYDALSNGELVTNTWRSDGKATELEATIVDPSSSTTAEVTIHQDTSGDGSSNHVETVTLSNGTNTYELSSFERVDGADYWLEIDLSSSDVTQTTQVDSLTLTTAVDVADALFAVSYEVGGTIYDIPVYDFEDVDRTAVRFRDDSGNEDVVGAARIIDHSDARAIVDHPEDGKLGLETIERDTE